MSKANWRCLTYHQWKENILRSKWWKNVFVRLSRVQNDISDVDFSVDYDDDYVTHNNEEPPLSEGLGTSGSVNMSNGIISDDSMREMIRSLNFHQR